MGEEASVLITIDTTTTLGPMDANVHNIDVYRTKTMVLSKSPTNQPPLLQPRPHSDHKPTSVVEGDVYPPPSLNG